eukprot:CAMPEP_0198117478 /NCGR_PEP_ID=MMETSP1442-20131203/18216_1 /TAXON_ID= /ORGANISM="Craspedostauros australis, Strain CCMP3328" /LENGTH=303 /DNA_ID=CAMNT_0043775535 /DNA_START=172 /DNA_END=1083 /DNA_ORIENTATION=+
MSDMATFVAATIRDKVVHDQQEQIHKLEQQVQLLESEAQTMRRRLKERNPMRDVQLTIGGAVHVANTLDVNVVDEDNGTDLFATDSRLCLPLQTMLQAELIIDGQLAVRLRDMDIVCEKFAKCNVSGDNIVLLRLEDNIGVQRMDEDGDAGNENAGDAGHNDSLVPIHPALHDVVGNDGDAPSNGNRNQQQEQQRQQHVDMDDDENGQRDMRGLRAYVYLGPFSLEEYSSLVRTPINALSTLRSPLQRDFCSSELVDAIERRCDVNDLLRVAPDKEAAVNFEHGGFFCSGEYFFDHLDVPYVP